MEASQLNRPVVTTVTGTAQAIGEFDRVTFNVSIEGVGPTSVEAKSKVKVPLDALQNFLKEAEREGAEFAKDKTVSPFNISRKTSWDDGGNEKFSHYSAVYALSFTVMGTERATVMLDKLTEINGLAVSSPAFSMGGDQRSKLYAEALEQAKDNALAAFKHECGLLDKNPDDFEITSWDFGNGWGPTGPQGAIDANGPTAVAAMGSPMRAKRIVVNPGEATVSATVHLSYSQTFKAIMAEFQAVISQ